MIKVEHGICELLQNSNISKNDLKNYIAFGSKDALVLLYLGLTCPKRETIIAHYIDEDDTKELLFVSRYKYKQDNIFEAEEGEITAVRKQVMELIQNEKDSENYREILVEETEDVEILRHFANQGDEKAKGKIEQIS